MGRVIGLALLATAYWQRRRLFRLWLTVRDMVTDAPPLVIEDRLYWHWLEEAS